MSNDAIRKEIVRIARGEIGPQKKGSPEVFGYWRDALPPTWTDFQVKQYAATKEWCGGFCLWVLHQAGVAKDVHWKDGLGFTEVNRLPHTKTPLPGDIGYKPSPYQHHFIVESLTPTSLRSIDGNQPDVRAYDRPAPSGITYYSIEPFLVKLAPPQLTIPTPPPVAPPPPLRLGSKGDATARWQRFLVGQGFKIVVDSDFGPQTEAATKTWQSKHGLASDGVVGLKTRTAAGLWV